MRMESNVDALYTSENERTNEQTNKRLFGASAKQNSSTFHLAAGCLYVLLYIYIYLRMHMFKYR